MVGSPPGNTHTIHPPPQFSQAGHDIREGDVLIALWILDQRVVVTKGAAEIAPGQKEHGGHLAGPIYKGGLQEALDADRFLTGCPLGLCLQQRCSCLCHRIH